jgi:hypothetical protein
LELLTPKKKERESERERERSLAGAMTVNIQEHQLKTSNVVAAERPAERRRRRTTATD